MKKLVDLLEKAKKLGPKTVAVAASEDEVVLKALDRATDEGIINAILVGNVEKTKKIAQDVGIEIGKFEFLQADNYIEAAEKAVQMVSQNKADFVMKGKIKTGDLMKVVLKEEYGLRTGRTLSLVSIFEVPHYDKLLIVSDAGMTIAPTLEQKVDIINNTVLVANRVLGIEEPKVAVLGAVEVVNPKMPATIEAAILSQMNKRKQIKRCIVDGPFALDNAVSKEAAEHKGIKSVVAGDADILIMPDIEAGNIFYKAMVFLAGAKVASAIIGAKVPVALTSRADSDETKLLSLALTGLMVGDRNV
ncbi:phosphate butyryltransferase [Thermosipho melanesiensis]|uniref:Phosphate butyryltransferase n=2 Tax=Thermosipho melanesiensis TaxID=46541 RepID=A6LJ84_THEM4|nr:bifunctional enoyl-CoA hydratase/phosphate acetyltransferase [Thermosipho melanesiensis]ABR29985.1 Phosphate butyryltransferase [Thermosipho melanesiensis BI429]APT73189.1 phosphate butyryltransferase [Thermosipho melanesiensis]OOC38584.1 phosphate butyryltransferase [Thermosipho melanesiensis]OOC40388.1 phosphate butyryltransferase [Thermosipho melanesiensis]OOC40652.1 phosphate butyryltransferase [Thermosipho melanesiensis]